MVFVLINQNSGEKREEYVVCKKKHYFRRKLFGVSVVEVHQNKPYSERPKLPKGTITFRDKTKYRRQDYKQINLKEYDYAD